MLCLLTFHRRQNSLLLLVIACDHLSVIDCSDTLVGDFEEVYGTDGNDDDEPQSGLWDAVLTCFFIDTV